MLRLVPLIPAVLLLALQPMSPAPAQSRSAAGTGEAGALLFSDLGNLYYLGGFSSVLDLGKPSGICGAFGLVGGKPILLSEFSAKSSPSRCELVVDAALGSRELSPDEMLLMPIKITSDSKDRVIVAADHGDIHIFDFPRRRHSFIAGGGPGDRLQSPAGLAVDGHDQLYVTDSELGAILVYRPNGWLRRYIGNQKGERLFERPAGIAVDRASGHIYVADPPRNVVVMLDADGNILAKIGAGAGVGSGELAAPTDVVVRNQELFVLDSQNSRIQVLDLAGHFRASIHPESAGSSGAFSVDSRGRIYLDGPLDTVHVFQRDGSLLYRFGHTGAGSKRARSVLSCIWIDSSDRIYVADSGNNRVETFQWEIKHVTKLPRP